MPEYLILLPLEPLTAGRFFQQDEPLPLHCTVMHWFVLSPSTAYEELNDQLFRIADETPLAIEIIADARTLFGPNNSVPVCTLQRSPDLELLHTNIFAALARLSSLPKELRWIGAGYRPHVTDLPGEQFRSRHFVRQLALIARDGSGKWVAQEYSLSSSF